MPAISSIRANAQKQIANGSCAAEAPFALEPSGKTKTFRVIGAKDPRATRTAQSAELRTLIADHFKDVSKNAADAKTRLAVQGCGRKLADRLLSDARLANKQALCVSDLDWVLGCVESAGKSTQAIESAINKLDESARYDEAKARALASAGPNQPVVCLDEPGGLGNLFKALANQQRVLKKTEEAVTLIAPFFNGLIHEEGLKEILPAHMRAEPPRPISSADIVGFLSAQLRDPETPVPAFRLMKDGFFSALREDESEEVCDTVIDFVNRLKLEFRQFSEAENSATGVNSLIPLLLLNLHPTHLQKMVVTHAQCDDLLRDTLLLLGQIHVRVTENADHLADKPTPGALATTINGFAKYAKEFMDSERGLEIAQNLTRSLTILRHNADRLESFVRSKHAGNPALEGQDISAVLDTYVPAHYSSAPQIELNALFGKPLALQYFPQEVVERPSQIAQAAPQTAEVKTQPEAKPAEAKAQRRDRAATVVMHVPAPKVSAPGEPTVEELQQVFAQAQPQRPAAQPGARQPQPAKHHHNSQFGGVVPKQRVAERSDAREMVRLGLFGLKKWGLSVKDALQRLSDARAEQSGSQQLVKPPSLRNPPNNRRTA
ncbi:hypothetical protein [Caenimonas koreensis]|uniref:Uncharacterized protein n=1 Tax=Caenimonas koreensis DSM 17982 TaxID=1121255 RepID=A0A844BD64_9BURK|nr:hypothetical protein [Caenimonas koreensis]MRD48441.1 hypothetical protein [Caenimonas koreensis DSM 17982]